MIDRSSLTALAILCAANTVLWRDRICAPAADFDHEAFGRGVATACAPLQIESARFDDEGLLPPSYSYYETSDEDQPWLSVYAGYFAGGGLLAEEPHDPAVCYVALGWNIAAGPTSITLGGRTITRIEVEREDYRCIAHYWQQRPDESAGNADTGLFARLWNRLQSARSDLVWIRVESEPDADSADETRALADRVNAIARAAAEALPGG